MTYMPRIIATNLNNALQRGKSVLLLGPRQTGKTTLINQQICPDISYSFASAVTRQRYEHDPALLQNELEERVKGYTHPPKVFIDEVQKIPRVLDSVQYLIDQQMAQFILTGSSARKLKTGRDVNLLPGRIVVLTMTPLLYEELPAPKPSIEEILLYGSLPGIITDPDNNAREIDLYSYVTSYLEDEIRAEALVRNIGGFSRFLEIAASESGKTLNFTKLSQSVGVADTTIAHYYQILEDCLIVARIDPITNSQTRRRLIKSPKYLFFDLGIRRICAHEGTRLPQKILGDLFEHYVGNALLNACQLNLPQARLKYWRDSSGPEVDYVVDIAHQYIPIEVKWSDKPTYADAKHLHKFIEEYPSVHQAYIICRTPHSYRISEKVLAIPWQEIPTVLNV